VDNSSAVPIRHDREHPGYNLAPAQSHLGDRSRSSETGVHNQRNAQTDERNDMKFRWVITQSNVNPYREFVERHKNHSIVKERIDRNLQHVGVAISKDHFWRALVGCLLTTQQRSGPNSRVAVFLGTNDQILDFDYCSNAKNLPKVVEGTLSKNGLRRTERIAEEIDLAVSWLKQGGWSTVKSQLDLIASHTSAKKERSVAHFLKEQFKGIGPKQSRNLIQWMGLSKYEIPLDSRMVKVLRELEFPVPLSSNALADEHYYCFIEDGIQKVMADIGVYPCVFDACAFASLETNG
jgi:hypothetical protein